jgi:hypothetical protein
MGKNWATDFCVTAEPDVVIVPRPAKGILAVMSDGLVENAEDELKLKPIGHVASAIASQIRKASGDLNKAAEATVVAHMMESVTALSEYSGDDLTLLLADIGNPIGGGHIPFQTPFTRKAGSGRRRARTNRVKRIPKTFVIS